jgi:hypothetical protein
MTDMTVRDTLFEQFGALESKDQWWFMTKAMAVLQKTSKPKKGKKDKPKDGKFTKFYVAPAAGQPKKKEIEGKEYHWCVHHGTELGYACCYGCFEPEDRWLVQRPK